MDTQANEKIGEEPGCSHEELEYARNTDSEKNVSDSESNHAPKLTDFKVIMLLVGFGMAFVGSQLQPLLFAAIGPLASSDLDASALLVWFFATQLISGGIVAPFAGPVADLFGRKRVAIAGVVSSMLGMILCGATPNATGYLAGQAFSGIGIAVQELTAISCIAEIVPTRLRGYYAALLITSFVPFCPASLYGELIAVTNWRYCACLIAVWNFFTALLIAIFYNPPARPNSLGLTWTQKLKRIDICGGLLMTSGIALFLIGFNWGGQAYPWRSARVIAFLTVGLLLLVGFLLYEGFLAPHPMFPGRLLQHPRTFMALMVVILLAGINYISVLIFWVLEAVGVYNSNHKELGIRTLPYGFCILGGAIISSLMISALKRHVKWIMTFFCIVQVTAMGCMAALDPHNINTAWGPLVFALIGVGGVLVPNQIIVTLICPDDLIATATSLTVCLRNIGQVIGISVFYTQFASVLTTNTYKSVIPAAIKAGIVDTTIWQAMMPALLATPWKEWVATVADLSTPAALETLHDAVISVFNLAFLRVWYISIAFGVSAVLASLFIENLTALMDEHIAVSYV